MLAFFGTYHICKSNEKETHQLEKQTISRLQNGHMKCITVGFYSNKEQKTQNFGAESAYHFIAEKSESILHRT